MSSRGRDAPLPQSKVDTCPLFHYKGTAEPIGLKFAKTPHSYGARYNSGMRFRIDGGGASPQGAVGANEGDVLRNFRRPRASAPACEIRNRRASVIRNVIGDYRDRGVALFLRSIGTSYSIHADRNPKRPGAVNGGARVARLRSPGPKASLVLEGF